MVRYVCRRCGRHIGQYEGDWTDPALGLHDLSPADQEQLLEWNDPGDQTTVKILCERCLPIPWEERLWYN